jgi:uncharacterized membrane protein YvbJ
MGKSKRKLMREKRDKANERKFIIYSIVITVVLLIIIFFVLKSMIG